MTETEEQPERDDETSGEPTTEPRGNPEPDSEDVERSEEGLDEVSGN
jgi:hypothetical protein